jgi:hypothetical protein
MSEQFQPTDEFIPARDIAEIRAKIRRAEERGAALRNEFWRKRREEKRKQDNELHQHRLMERNRQQDERVRQHQLREKI